MATIREANEQLQHSMHEFMRTVRSMSAQEFTEPIDDWAARDVVAHLIGWNRSSIEIADAISRGEVPSVLVDPGEDFVDVNATFVQKYDSTDTNELLRELELSYQELARHLFTLDDAVWTRPVQVPGWSQPVTLERSIVELSDDYDHHRQELVKWLESRARV